MPDSILDGLWKEYVKLTDGVVEESANLSKKVRRIDDVLGAFGVKYVNAAARNAGVGLRRQDIGKVALQLSDMTRWELVGFGPVEWVQRLEVNVPNIVARADAKANLSDEELVALGADAIAAATELAAAKALATEGRVKRTLLGHDGWIKYALKKYTENGPGKLSDILDDVRKLSAADQAAFDAQARAYGVLKDMLAAKPELAGNSVDKLWMVYADDQKEWLKVVGDKVNRWVQHPEEFDAKVKKLDTIVAQLAALLTAREKARTKKTSAPKPAVPGRGAKAPAVGSLGRFLKERVNGRQSGQYEFTLSPSRDPHFKFPHWPV
jgi:hypothetical protein